MSEREITRSGGDRGPRFSGSAVPVSERGNNPQHLSRARGARGANPRRPLRGLCHILFRSGREDDDDDDDDDNDNDDDVNYDEDVVVNDEDNDHDDGKKL